MSTNEEIAEAWVRSELAGAANAYQTFAREVWQAIIERTNEATERQVGQATQLARVNDALAFLGEANTARNHHLATFQGNVELWAAEHQARVSYLETQLQRAQEAIQRVADRVPVPPTPTPEWRSPAPIPSTSALSPPPDRTYQPTLRSPLRLGRPRTPGSYQAPWAPGTTSNPLLAGPAPSQRRSRPPAIPATPPPLRGPLAGGAGGPPSGPPSSGPSTPPLPPSPGPQRPPQHRRRASPPPGPALTPQELVQLVAEGIARAQQYKEPEAP